MPSRALSANELMEHGTRATTVQHNTVRDQSCAQQVCVCISVLLRHLAVPPKLLLLDLLLASYLVLRAGDERGTVLRLGGGKVSLHLMQSCWCAVNPLYYREVGGNNVFLSFEEALRCLNLHPVQKDGNPFRGDPFADALRAYWSNPHAGLSVAAMFLAVVFILSTRSKILLQFFVAHPDADLTDLSILPKLYDLALQHGPQLGDGGTVHAAGTSVGNLVDSILLPYWRQPLEHPVTTLVQCRSIRDARQLLMQIRQIPHFGSWHWRTFLVTLPPWIWACSDCPGRSRNFRMPNFHWHQTPERGWRYAGQAASSLRVPVGLRKRHGTGCRLCQASCRRP